jgi:DNA-binding CsgD family transcriptional regulator
MNTETHGATHSEPLVALRAVAAITEQVCALPAVATLNWCDRAAEALRPPGAGAWCCVGIVDADPRGRVLRVEAVGAATATSGGDQHASPASVVDIHAGGMSAEVLRARLASARTLGAAPEAEPCVRVLADASIPGPGLWTDTPVRTTVVGVARLGANHPDRCLVAVLGGPEGTRPEMLAATLGAALPLLAARALSAVGPEPTTRHQWVSPREQEVLDLLVLGHSVREIADRLSRSPHTVHDHVKSLHRKLNACSRGELVARALGFVPAGRSATTPIGAGVDVTEPVQPVMKVDVVAYHAENPGRATPLRAERVPA